MQKTNIKRPPAATRTKKEGADTLKGLTMQGGKPPRRGGGGKEERKKQKDPLRKIGRKRRWGIDAG